MYSSSLQLYCFWWSYSLFRESALQGSQHWDVLFANYYAFANLGTGAGFITLVVSGVACVGSLVGFMRSKTLDKLALKKDITSKIDNSAANKIKVGDMGITTTRLAQIGYAEIEGNIIEVKSTEGLLDEKTPIIVNRIADGTIFVEKQKP